MRIKQLIKRVLLLAVGLATFSIGIFFFTPSIALAQVGTEGTFTATRACNATRSIRGGENPGNIKVSPKQRYQAIGFNSAEKTFIYIKIPGATPENRWVNAKCGTFSQKPFGGGSGGGTPTPSPESKNLLPFFDNENNGNPDPTPLPPTLTKFDTDVLKACGEIGSPVKASSFRQLMSENPQVFQKIKNSVNGELFANRKTDAEFLDDLTAIWFDKGGFEHIFCGELEGKNKIGGLHFFGRYLELQQQKRGGRLPNNTKKEEIVPGVIYTLGIRIVDKNQKIVSEDDLKGYALVSNAEEILIDGTQAFKKQGKSQGACLYTVSDQETGKTYKAVFVKGQGQQAVRDAVVTFYPDATPSGKDCKN